MPCVTCHMSLVRMELVGGGSVINGATCLVSESPTFFLLNNIYNQIIAKVVYFQSQVVSSVEGFKMVFRLIKISE